MDNFRFTADIIFGANNYAEAIERLIECFTSLRTGQAYSTSFSGDFDLSEIKPNGPTASQVLPMQPISKGASARLNNVLAGGASYDQRTVLSTSVPPLEELNKEGLPELGKDIL